ncbi:hypothetical protein C8R46DRAFT_1216686 [Mycena filopes]|nr:hypothetical protein C8R46DRAFT_1216686 [Mycena filopes]
MPVVEVVQVDWATVLEIDAFTSSTDALGIKPTPPDCPQVLFVGDSIILTCGLAFKLEASDGGQPINPRGVLDAFPAQAVAILRESYPLSLEAVAYQYSI